MRILRTFGLHDLSPVRMHIDRTGTDEFRALENLPPSDVENKNGEADVLEHESRSLEVRNKCIVACSKSLVTTSLNRKRRKSHLGRRPQEET